VGGASAQVVIYGTVDAAVTSYSQDGYTKTGLGNSQLGSSKIGFMGTEDLGDGLKATFKLEGGLANDSGNGKASNTNNQASGAAGQLTQANGTQGLDFQRYSYVGLTGGFGEVRLGRDYLNVYQYATAGFDPFGTNGPADSAALTLNLAARLAPYTAANASNMLGYISPKMSGVTLRLQAFAGEGTNSTDGSGYSAQAEYAVGPLLVSGGQQVTTGTPKAAKPAVLSPASAGALATPGDYTQAALGASYDFGMAKVVFTSVQEKLVFNDSATGTNNSNLIGVIVPLGAFNYKVSYIASVFNGGASADVDQKGTLIGLGADYALSKRTKLYGTLSQVTNDGGIAGTGSQIYSAGNFASGKTAGTDGKTPTSNGAAIGIFHTF